MLAIEAISETLFINNLVRSFPRPAMQLNNRHESDAEIIRIPGTDVIIAITTDGISEEIEQGLYTDPYLIGYMIVVMNLSDLAAVGASPLGLVLNHTLTHDLNKKFLERLNCGIADACELHSTGILGGDTNFSSRLQMGGTALGFCASPRVLSRRGCVAGDLLFSSGRLGDGNAFAFSQLGHIDFGIEYRPLARLREGAIVAQYGSSCIDTSDGCLAALDQLARINDVGATITASFDKYISESSLRLCKAQQFPEWFLLAGPHGEFELMFTIARAAEKKFLEAADAIDWRPLRLGEITGQSEIALRYGGRSAAFDTARIRNLSFSADGGLKKYLNEFNLIEQTLHGGVQ